eukprot:scaffold182599_cov17-Prasinocladus_malaysianus.AAC.1
MRYARRHDVIAKHPLESPWTGVIYMVPIAPDDVGWADDVFTVDFATSSSAYTSSRSTTDNELTYALA